MKSLFILSTNVLLVLQSVLPVLNWHMGNIRLSGKRITQWANRVQQAINFAHGTTTPAIAPVGN